MHRMLVTLRVFASDGKQYLLAAEVDEPPATPAQLLERFNKGGRIAVSDRASLPVDEIARVEFESAERLTAPTWLGDLRDEDVASAMEGRFEKPPHEEPLS